MNDHHLVVGAGTVGSALASQLRAAGADVTVVTRSGSGPQVPGIRTVALDASNATALLESTPASVAIYNCVSPPYHRWPQEWPPLAAAFIAYAQRTGAVLVTCSNLYGYGPQSVPLTEDLALAATGSKGRVRAKMWADALALHHAGEIRSTEVRGSDYLSPGAQSRMGDRVVPRILSRKGVQLVGALDTPHTWTSPNDVARLMAVVGGDERAWGRAWHVPSNAPRTQREVVCDIADAAACPQVRVSEVPASLLWGLGLVNPGIRELKETDYQFSAPFILDDTAARTAFGLEPTPWSTMLAHLVTSYR